MVAIYFLLYCFLVLKTDRKFDSCAPFGSKDLPLPAYMSLKYGGHGNGIITMEILSRDLWIKNNNNEYHIAMMCEKRSNTEICSSFKGLLPVKMITFKMKYLLIQFKDLSILWEIFVTFLGYSICYTLYHSINF